LIMDEEGPQWCRNNIKTIVGWLKEEAEERHLPFTVIGATILVKLAIRNAERKQRLLNDE
jgi:hypothetical protein